MFLEEARLSARLDPALFGSFKVDLVAVTRAGVRPDRGTVLFGSPSLFQRLYMKASRPQPLPGHTTALASLFGPSLAFATTPFNSVDPLVAHGANVFFNKKFGGNGRVCATCHPADHNFTIDPNYISTLAPDDPLFVAETVPALAANFEKPKLLRGLGLILENPDGFDDLGHKFVMRGVPHLLGLSRYLEPGNQSIPPNQRTGWGGDGAPGSGTLREFATGAVIAHYTKTLNRVPGVDFRLPTDFDLDGLEAFLLGLGRQDNPDIANTHLKDPVAQKGNELFQGDNASCTTCHVDGGANQSDGKSHTFDIGLGRLPNHPANLIDPGNLPPDGGFGRDPVNDAHTGEFLGYGLNGQIRFKTFPAIEAVNTPPFFHNNAVSTIEEAVNYYNSDAFKASFAGQFFTIDLAPTEVEAIAVFLRVMDSLENIRSSSVLVQGAIEEHDTATAQRLINFAIANTKDSFGVLEARHLHQSAVFRLKVALNKQLQAATVSDATARNALLSRSLQLMSLAKGEMVE